MIETCIASVIYDFDCIFILRLLYYTKMKWEVRDMAILFTVFGACALAPYIVCRVKKRLMPGILFKIFTSICFLLTTCAAAIAWPPDVFAQSKHLFFGILAGQMFGLLGDCWLDMKDMIPKDHDAYVYAGFSSFLIGHLFFIAGLLASYGFGSRTILFMAGAALLLCAVVLATEKPMKLKYGKFKGITAGYTAVFGMSIAAALCSWLYAGRSPQALVMFIGLVVFLLSDLVLSGTYFGEGKTRPIDYTLNYIFYYGGQFTIALSLLLIVYR